MTFLRGVRFTATLALAISLGACHRGESLKARESNTPPPQTSVTIVDRDARLASIPQGRSDHYRKRMGIFLAELPTIEPGGTLFLGDSLTEQYPLALALPGTRVINQGIGGDNITGVMERLDIAAATQPARIYLTIGTNNIAWFQSVDIAPLVPDYGRLLDALVAQIPGAPLTVLSIPPVAGKHAHANPAIRAMNAEISKLCADRGIPVIDLYGQLADEQGDLRTEFHTDGVHLNILGYWNWSRALRTPDEEWETAKAICNRWTEVRSATRRADKIDPPAGNNVRGENQLVVYTPRYGAPTTLTNQWGREAIVRNGVVESANAGNSTIPADGFVVSGHGSAAAWVGIHLQPGVPVEMLDDTVSIPQVPIGDLPHGAQMLRAEDALMKALAGREGAEREKLRAAFDQLDALRSQEPGPGRTWGIEVLVKELGGGR